MVVLVLFSLSISPLRFGRPDDWPVSLWGAGRVGACRFEGMTGLNDFGFVSMEFKPCKSEFEHVCLFAWRTIGGGFGLRRVSTQLPFMLVVVFVLAVAHHGGVESGLVSSLVLCLALACNGVGSVA
jgi:hypothetical protein